LIDGLSGGAYESGSWRTIRLKGHSILRRGRSVRGCETCESKILICSITPIIKSDPRTSTCVGVICCLEDLCAIDINSNR
jgi:hypothetical protein